MPQVSQNCALSRFAWPQEPQSIVAWCAHGIPESMRGRKALRTESCSPAGERRQLTVLFCDLVGSTPPSQQLDAEEWRDVISRYQRAATEAVEKFGRHVAKNLGDGLLIYFGWPTAREDDPERAVRAGLAIVDAVRSLDTRPEKMAATRDERFDPPALNPTRPPRVAALPLGRVSRGWPPASACTPGRW
ncbi:MAG: adenylate/guanylate cyclase domain-containing protein, partial [Candidatus Binatia bacterium]